VFGTSDKRIPVVSLKLYLLHSRISRVEQNTVSNVANSGAYHPSHGKWLFSDANITSVWENRRVMGFFMPPIVDVMLVMAVVIGLHFRICALALE
jgi:hypothetical protein